MRESQTSGRSTILVAIIILISMQFAVITLNVDEESFESSDFNFGDICGATGGACDQLNPPADGTQAAFREAVKIALPDTIAKAPGQKQIRE